MKFLYKPIFGWKITLTILVLGLILLVAGVFVSAPIGTVLLILGIISLVICGISFGANL